MSLDQVRPDESESSRMLESWLRLGSLTDREQRSAYLREHPELVERDVVSAIRDHVLRQVRIDPRGAVAIAEAAVAISEHLADPDALAHAFRIKANTLYFNGDYRTAIDWYERSARLFDDGGNADEYARTLSSSMQPRILVGEYDDALAAAAEARSIFERSGDLWRIGRLEINVGNVYHRQDRFEEALACYRRALDALEARSDPESSAAALSNMATCLIGLDDFARALETHERGRAFCKAHGMTSLVRQADYNVAWLHFMRGEYGVAIDRLVTLRETCRQYDDRLHYALCHLDLAEIYANLSLLDDAAEAAGEGARCFEEIGMGYERAKCLAIEATVLGRNGDVAPALELFAEARRAFARENNEVWPFVIDLSESQLLCRDERYDDALRLSNRALGFFDGSSLQSRAVMCRLVAATIALRTGDTASGLAACSKAVEDLDRLEIPQLAFDAHLLMGELQIAANLRGLGYEQLRLARSKFESLRGSVSRPELRIAIVGGKRRMYEQLVDLCLTGNSGGSPLEEAFEYIEEDKSRTLSEMIQASQEVRPAGVHGGEADRARLRELRHELNWMYRRIEQEQLQPSEHSSERVAMQQQRAREREREYARAIRELPERSSDARTGSIDSLRTVRVPEIQELIGHDSTLLSWFITGERVLACVITSERLEIVPVCGISQLRKQLAWLRFQFSKMQIAPELTSSFEAPLFRAVTTHLGTLYDELMRPLERWLDRENLIIVQHGPLHHVPFHALFDGGQYLSDRFVVSHAPSATAYWLCQRSGRPDTQASLVMALPDERAPFILDEARVVNDVLPGSRLLIGDDASIRALREAGSSLRFLHIATHGVFRDDNPMFSSIKLGDGYLNFFDLAELQLNAELVTLSGCSTGLSGVGEGDELLGLLRGLLGAGARSLLLSLWNVGDDSTAAFMSAFYRSLQSGIDKPRAVRAAMHEIRERFPHPYHWAPFQLIGAR